MGAVARSWGLTRNGERMKNLLFLLFCAFIVVDCVAYGKAKYPHRTLSWIYKLPGGGFAALRTYGRCETPD